MKHSVAPSILSANFANLQADIELINRSKADWFHVDIMDGMFVPNISFGFPVLSAVKRYAQKPLDVHLMIVDPDRYLRQFQEGGADHIIVHYEACTHLHRTIHAIRDLGCRAGVALNPHTPVMLLHDIIADLDQVLIMSVNPGFGGQQFITNTYDKIRELRALAAGRNDRLIIEIDGGVSADNTLDLLKAGANALVAGSSIFSASNPEQAIAEMKSADPREIDL
ncbi:ribulose-phosphate 3-epimerase [bacterium A37T11]|nr:ribulose-phosphate 3-epimerase [bacterium A37T11]